MNTTTQHHHELAAKLTSLSLAPAILKTEPPERSARRRIMPLAVLALAAAVGAGALFMARPDVFWRAGGGIADFWADSPDHGTAASRGAEARGAAPAQAGAAAPLPPGAAGPGREIAGSGYVVAPDIATVFSKYEGRIVAVEVEAGDRVVAGQMLVRLDDAGAAFALRGAGIAERAAELTLEARNIALAQARSSLGRTERLAGRDAMPAEALEQAKTAFDAAANAAEQARQDLQKAKLDLDRAREQVDALTVRAPISGTVTRLDAHAGDTVLSREDSVRENESLLVITDTASLVIDADVAEANMALMRPGLAGEAVLDGFPDRPFAVEVVKIAPVVSREKGTVTLRLSLVSPPPGMRPAMAARIRLVVGEEAVDAAQNNGRWECRACPSPCPVE